MTTREIFQFDNTYATELEGMYAAWKGAVLAAPSIVKFNRVLAEELGLDADELDNEEGAHFLSGSKSPEGASPLAQVYAGHQFGGFSPQLGDGRALLVGELIDAQGVRRDLHLKGSGATPFSRGGDGRAAIGPVLREYLVGEFMHVVGVPTTRSLAATLSGETVMRDSPLPGAVLARVASSHLRVGTFEFFARRGDKEKLQRLADYAIKRHFPELFDRSAPYLNFLRAVVHRQAELVAKWMAVGFVHGVMNTDNTTISGETIDYGPCAFIDGFDPKSVFSSIDQGGRYAYDSQAAAAKWNLYRLAETLLGLINPEDVDQAAAMATEAVEQFPQFHEQCLLTEMGAKLGLRSVVPADGELVEQLMSLMMSARADFTMTFRGLAASLRGDAAPVRKLFAESKAFDDWLERWRVRYESEPGEPQDRAIAMDRINPLYIPRNHKVEEALEAATALDFKPFEKLLSVLDNPFVESEGQSDFAEPAPGSFGPYTTYCGT
ncbi:MAG: hypothetical protein ACI87A_002423 [Planctomycetota bacterium]|jgi:uncharacterized protein YdiU (UPF0061 family)